MLAHHTITFAFIHSFIHSRSDSSGSDGSSLKVTYHKLALQGSSARCSRDLLPVQCKWLRTQTPCPEIPPPPRKANCPKRYGDTAKRRLEIIFFKMPAYRSQIFLRSPPRTTWLTSLVTSNLPKAGMTGLALTQCRAERKPFLSLTKSNFISFSIISEIFLLS